MNFTAFIVAAFVFAAPAMPAVPKNVAFSEGFLTVNAVELRLEDLVQEISKQSGIRIELKDPRAAERRVTLKLDNVAPPLALEEILRGFNFAWFYENGRLSRVVVLSQDTSVAKLPPARAPKPSQPAGRPAAPRADAPLDFNGLLSRNRAEGLMAIAQALKGADQKQKIAALDALETIDGPEVLALLRQALADSDAAIRKTAISVVADKEDPGVIPLLRAALRDSDPLVRLDVLDALADKRQMQLVKTALSDPHDEVRERAHALVERMVRQPNFDIRDQQKSGFAR